MQDRKDVAEWVPKTYLGRIVMKGEFTTMAAVLQSGLVLREPEIVDILLPELEDEVLDVNMVQRMTDSGRRVNFAVTTVVGNGDGFVGVGRARGKEVGPTIRRSIDNAKVNVIEVKRGCGSWECGCLRPHSLPFQVTGKSGSVVVTLKPAPRGVGLAMGDIAKSVVAFAGVQDAWGFTRGHTKTTVNYSLATFNALAATGRLRVRADQADRLKIRAGAENVYTAGAPSAVGESTGPADESAETSAGVEETRSEKGASPGGNNT